LIVWGRTREEAIERMRRALYEYKITGVKTTIRFLERIMDTPDFRNGNYNTHFIEKNTEFLMSDGTCNKKCEDIALIATFAEYLNRIEVSKKINASPSVKKETNWKRQIRKFTSRM
jgi:acetyl-CoA carboxylase biotin carboxylase subunit